MNVEPDSAKPGVALEDSAGCFDASLKGAFFERTDWLSFGVTTLAALIGYLLTLTPEVGLGFSGIFSTAAMYGGVPNPPGYPLWTLWALPFTKLLPFSNIAWRAAVATAVAGALACGVIALMVSRGSSRVIRRTPTDQGQASSARRWLRAICGCTAGLVFGFNGAFWALAVIPDPWPLSLLFVTLLLCLLMRWSYQPERKRYLYAAAFVYGLTLTNSQIELALLPAIPIVATLANRRLGRDMFALASILLGTRLYSIHFGDGYRYDQINWAIMEFMSIFLVLFGFLFVVAVTLVAITRRLFTEWKVLLTCCGLFVLGLGLYLYLPVAAMTNPPVNWGYARTVEGFVHLVGREQYDKTHCIGHPSTHLLKHQAIYWRVIGKEFGWPYLLVAMVPFFGFRLLTEFGRRWVFGLLSVFACLSVLMLVVLDPSDDRHSVDLIRTFYSASYIVMALWMGYGLIILGNQVASHLNDARDAKDQRT